MFRVFVFRQGMSSFPGRTSLRSHRQKVLHVFELSFDVYCLAFSSDTIGTETFVQYDLSPLYFRVEFCDYHK